MLHVKDFCNTAIFRGFPLETKFALIRHAREEYGLHVLGEVGKKEGLESHVDLAEDAAGCLDAGAEVVFLEAADFLAGGFLVAIGAR